MVKKELSSHFPYIVIVCLVAIVAVVVLVLNMNRSADSGNFAGQAIGFDNVSGFDNQSCPECPPIIYTSYPLDFRLNRTSNKLMLFDMGTGSDFSVAFIGFIPGGARFMIRNDERPAWELKLRSSAMWDIAFEDKWINLHLVRTDVARNSIDVRLRKA